jgi:hypothetical protein
MTELLSEAEFASILKQEVEDLQGKEGFKEKSDALAFWYGLNVLALSRQDVKNACRFQGKGEQGMDFFYLDTSRKKIVIGQAEATENLDPAATFGSSSIRKLRSAISALAHPDKIDEGDRIIDAVDDYREFHLQRDGAEKFSVELLAIVSGRPSGGMVKDAASFSADLAERPKHELKILDFGRLLEEYCESVDKRPPPDFHLRIRSDTIKFAGNALVVSVPGEEIRKLVKDNKLALFEKNARIPLLKGKANPEILDQLETEEKRGKFWYLNNGLTVTCRLFRPEDQTLRVFGAQIVNGCQTAWMISKSKKPLDNVWVLTKVIQTEDHKFAYDIRRATNLQTEITLRDLCSNDFIQLKLQKSFEQLGYYYERKKDEWKVRKKVRPAMVDQFLNGNADNEKLGQCFLAFVGKPHEAKDEKREVFGKFRREVFPNTRTARELLLPWLVRRDLRSAFQVGHRRHGERKTVRYYVRTVGDLTILAFVGEIVRRKYHIFTQSARASGILRMLVERFEDQEAHPEFFSKYDKVIKRVLQATESWAKRRKTAASKKGEEWDVRELHIGYHNALRDPGIRKAIHKGVASLPAL